MRGDLVEKSAADVCRDLAASEASGVLAIDGPDGPGRVVFSGGRIVTAMSPAPRARLGGRLIGAGKLDSEALATVLASQGENGTNARLGEMLVEHDLVDADVVRGFLEDQVLDALFEIIRWRYGAYAFVTGGAGAIGGIPVSLAVDDALVDVARRQREWQQLSQVIPDLEAVPSFRRGAASASASLEPDEFAVLASVDGERSIRGLAANLGYGEFEAARIVYGLSLLGIVDVRPPRDAVGAALEDAMGSARPGRDPDGDGPQPPEPADGNGSDRPPPKPAEEAGSDRPPPPDFFATRTASASVVTDDPDDTSTHRGPGDPADMPPSDERPGAPDEHAGEVPVASTTDGAEEIDDAREEGVTLDIMFDVDTRPDQGYEGWARDHDHEPQETTPASAFAELYADPPRRPHADSPRADGPPTDRPGTDDPRTEPDVRRSTPSARTAPQRGDDNDVSEFLRELSRLSVDAPRQRSSPPEPYPPTPTPTPPPPPPREPGRKKRRGIFGRG